MGKADIQNFYYLQIGFSPNLKPVIRRKSRVRQIDLRPFIAEKPRIFYLLSLLFIIHSLIFASYNKPYLLAFIIVQI